MTKLSWKIDKGKYKMPDKVEKLSVQVRLKKTIVEYAYVNVEVTSDVITEDNSLSGEKIFELAIEYSCLPQMEWYLEQQSIEIHPIQKPREPNEHSLFKTQDSVELL